MSNSSTPISLLWTLIIIIVVIVIIVILLKFLFAVFAVVPLGYELVGATTTTQLTHLQQSYNSLSTLAQHSSLYFQY